jgi:hypothetical protein
MMYYMARYYTIKLFVLGFRRGGEVPVMEKWIRSAIPALLIHCSIGTVYCWSTFKEAVANAIGMSPFAVGWAFSLAIFFL